MPKKMKLDHYLDIGCSVCGKHRSTDEFKNGGIRGLPGGAMGLWEGSADGLRRTAAKEGWTVTEDGLPICPDCSHEATN